MPVLPERPSLDHLRRQATSRKRDRAVPLATAQREPAREYGFVSWAALVHHVEATGLTGLDRALVLADATALRDRRPDLGRPAAAGAAAPLHGHARRRPGVRGGAPGPGSPTRT